MMGMALPPRMSVVNKTKMSVDVTITCRTSSSMFRFRLRAKAMAPLSPLNHMMNCIFLVIWCSRK